MIKWGDLYWEMYPHPHGTQPGFTALMFSSCAPACLLLMPVFHRRSAQDCPTSSHPSSLFWARGISKKCCSVKYSLRAQGLSTWLKGGKVGGEGPAPGETLPALLQALCWAITWADLTYPPHEPVKWELLSPSFLDEEIQSQGSSVYLFHSLLFFKGFEVVNESA